MTIEEAIVRVNAMCGRICASGGFAVVVILRDGRYSNPWYASWFLTDRNRRPEFEAKTLEELEEKVEAYFNPPTLVDMQEVRP